MTHRRSWDPFAPHSEPPTENQPAAVEEIELEPKTRPELKLEPVPPPTGDLDELRKPELVARATELHLDPTGTRADLIDRIRAHQAPPTP